jgi:hypothetical protein
MPFTYELRPDNPGVRNTLRSSLDRLLNETLPALRDQADRTVDALASARARAAERDDTRAAARADLRNQRMRGRA